MIKFSKEIYELATRKLPKANNIVLLCSSGVDSIAGTHYLANKLNNSLAGLLHFNHQQRPQNDVMADSYFKFGREQGINGWGSAKLGAYIKSNTEDNLRKARLNFIKSHWDNSIFISCHHLDDATESYMMNCIRGKEGFLPIPFITEVGSNIICHPFLLTKKQDFIDYAVKNDLMKYVVEDDTNKETRGSRRNFLRNEIMPLLVREKIGLDTIVKKKIKQRLLIELLK